MIKLEQLDETSTKQILEWCGKQKLTEQTKSSYVNGRREKWYRLGSNLQSIALKRATIFKCDEAPDFINKIGDKYLKGWNSLLVCGGPTSINWHRDHGHFFGKSVMINIGQAYYSEGGHRDQLIDKVEESYITHPLATGDIVQIDTKLLHKSTQIAEVRFNLTFRTIKPEFLKDIK